MRRPLALIAAVVVVAGCASATKRMEEGMALEREGRWTEAAYRYAEAVEKDDTLSVARRRLAVATDSAVSQALAEASRRGAGGAWVEAADRYLEVDALLGRVREVGYRPDLPEGFAAARRDALDAAGDQLMEEAADARRAGRWSSARSAYQRLRARYQPSFDLRQRSWEEEAELLAEWATDDLDARRYRAAWARAEEGRLLSEAPSRTVVERLAAIQEAAEREGTRFVVVLPVSARSVVGGMDAQRFALHLSDVLELEHWRLPPPLVAVADPTVVRREVRRRSGIDGVLSPRETARILDAMDADYGVSVEVASLTLEERVERSETVEARTRDGRRVTYEVRRVRLRFEASAETLVLDAEGRRLTDFVERASASDVVQRAVYVGDLGDLNLGRNERRLFDPAVERSAQLSLLEEVADRLAADLGPRILQEVVRRIP